MISLLALVLVWIGSLLPGDALRHEWLTTDKLVHAVAWFCVTWFALLAQWPLRVWYQAFILFLCGLVIECLQEWIPGRQFDWFDVVANSGGIALAWWVKSLFFFKEQS